MEERIERRIKHLEKSNTRLWQCLCIQGITIAIITICSPKGSIISLILRILGL